MVANPGADVVVVGGGITGAATTYELARAGVNVTLVEQGELASMASGWTLGGIRQSGRDPAEFPLIRRAIQRWQQLGDELGADLEYRQEGNLRLARTPAEVETIHTMVETQRALGLEIACLADNRAVREVAPCLSEQVLAASFCPGDGHAHPVKTVQALASAAKRLGATLLTGTRMTGLRVTNGRVHGVSTTRGEIPAGQVLLATGVYTPRLLEPLGIQFPLTVQHVSVMQSTPLPPLLNQVLGVANADLAGRQQVDGRLRFTSGLGPWHWPAQQLEEEQLRPRLDLLATLVQRISKVFPAFGEARLAQVWGGLIDLSPDHLPVMDTLSDPAGLVIAAGFSGHGFGIGPASGELLRDLLLGQRPAVLEPFGLARLAGQTPPGQAELYG